VEELAPELVPMLTSLEMPANFVPMTNAVLAEMARRGIARDRILATLRRMGGEMPLGSLRLLQWAARAGIDIRILSDCNSLFIGHMLIGAPLSPFCCAPEAKFAPPLLLLPWRTSGSGFYCLPWLPSMPKCPFVLPLSNVLICNIWPSWLAVMQDAGI
jgi:hypothetical protein